MTTSASAKAYWAKLTPEERAERTQPAREAAKRAALDRWAQNVAALAPELTQAQKDVIVVALGAK